VALKTMAGPYFFDEFELDPEDRRLSRAGSAIDVSARYLAALELLVAARGRLVTKDQFLDSAWRGVPVTDEALTQCIRSLRKALGDDAARPRFIETVPKHGYRFIADVSDGRTAPAAGDERWRKFVLLSLAGAVGAGLAGLVGGAAYGLVLSADPFDAAVGAASAVLVLTAISILVAFIGGLGVALGIAAAHVFFTTRGLLAIVGGAAGGLLVGALGKMIGLDLFWLLVGNRPGDITGAIEGLVLGAATGVGWLVARTRSTPLQGALVAGLCGGAGGLALGVAGRPLMAGSLAALVDQMPNARLRLDPLTGIAGDIGKLAMTALEGGLFAAALVLAMLLANRQLGDD
jgi:DNA-binding winged helix-turn-helix (wHTH) protein